MEFRFHAHGYARACVYCLNMYASTRAGDIRLAPPHATWVGLHTVPPPALHTFIASNWMESLCSHLCDCICCTLPCLGLCLAYVCIRCYDDVTPPYSHEHGVLIWTDRATFEDSLLVSPHQWSHPIRVSLSRACWIAACAKPFAEGEREGYVSLCPACFPSFVFPSKEIQFTDILSSEHEKRPEEIRIYLPLPSVLQTLVIAYEANVVENILEHAIPVRMSMD